MGQLMTDPKVYISQNALQHRSMVRLPDPVVSAQTTSLAF